MDVSETVDGDGKADAPKGQEFGIPVAWAYTEQMYDCHQFLMGRYQYIAYNTMPASQKPAFSDAGSMREDGRDGVSSGFLVRLRPRKGALWLYLKALVLRS